MNTLIALHFCPPDMTAHNAPRGKPPAPAIAGSTAESATAPLFGNVVGSPGAERAPAVEPRR